MKYTIRELNSNEYKILEDFLYEAIFIPEGVDSPSRDIIKQPELQLYISEFGKEDDNAFVAEIDGKVVGAVWTRIMNDYGHIDNKTPSLAMSLYKEYRGYGIGTALLEGLLTKLRHSKYAKVSLSVQKANYAAKMYLKIGFEIVWENEEEYIMTFHL